MKNRLGAKLGGMGLNMQGHAKVLALFSLVVAVLAMGVPEVSATHSNEINPNQSYGYLTNSSDWFLVDVRWEYELTCGSPAVVNDSGYPIWNDTNGIQRMPVWIGDDCNPSCGSAFNNTVNDYVNAGIWDKSTTKIITMCQAGVRAHRAQLNLEQLGFSNVYNMCPSYKDKQDGTYCSGSTTTDTGWKPGYDLPNTGPTVDGLSNATGDCDGPPRFLCDGCYGYDITPTHNANLSSSTVTFMVTVRDMAAADAGRNLTNVSLYFANTTDILTSDVSIPWHGNQTNDTGLDVDGWNTVTFTVTLPPGTYIWNVQAYDNESRENWLYFGYGNRTFTILEDIYPPNITVIEPRNMTYNNYTNYVKIRYSIVDANEISWVAYNFNNGTGNVTVRNSTTTLVSDIGVSVTPGTYYNVTIWANDSYGNVGNATVYFNISALNTTYLGLVNSNSSDITITNGTLNATDSTLLFSNFTGNLNLTNVTIENSTVENTNLTNVTTIHANISSGYIESLPGRTAYIQIAENNVWVNFTNVYERVAIDDLILGSYKASITVE